MIQHATTYYLVFTNESSPRDRPRGLYRQEFRDGLCVGEHAYHPRTGWHDTDYWSGVQYRGADEKFLVEVDEGRAQEVRSAFDRLHGVDAASPLDLE